MIEDYFRQIGTLIAGASIVHSSSITYDKRSTYVGFIRGEVYFPDLPTFLHHKHEGSESNAVTDTPPDLQAVLAEFRV